MRHRERGGQALDVVRTVLDRAARAGDPQPELAGVRREPQRLVRAVVVVLDAEGLVEQRRVDHLQRRREDVAAARALVALAVLGEDGRLRHGARHAARRAHRDRRAAVGRAGERDHAERGAADRAVVDVDREDVVVAARDLERIPQSVRAVARVDDLRVHRLAGRALHEHCADVVAARRAVVAVRVFRAQHEDRHLARVRLLDAVARRDRGERVRRPRRHRHVEGAAGDLNAAQGHVQLPHPRPRHRRHHLVRAVLAVAHDAELVGLAGPRHRRHPAVAALRLLVAKTVDRLNDEGGADAGGGRREAGARRRRLRRAARPGDDGEVERRAGDVVAVEAEVELVAARLLDRGLDRVRAVAEVVEPRTLLAVAVADETDGERVAAVLARVVHHVVAVEVDHVRVSRHRRQALVVIAAREARLRHVGAPRPHQQRVRRAEDRHPVVLDVHRVNARLARDVPHRVQPAERVVDRGGRRDAAGRRVAERDGEVALRRLRLVVAVGVLGEE